MSHTLRPLTNARSSAIGAGVTAAYDYYTPVARVLDLFEKPIALEAAVLRRQKIHREVDAGELSARYLKITRRTCSRSNADGIELRA